MISIPGIAFAVSFVLAACANPQKAPNPSPDILAIRAVGRYDFHGEENADPALVAEELSGIVHLEGNEYLAVGDDHACVHRLLIRLDRESGRILSVAFGKPVRLCDEDGSPLPEPGHAMDREGIAYDPESRSVWIANERCGSNSRRPSLARHSLNRGKRTAKVDPRSAPGLEAFTRIRSNFGFESLTRMPDEPTYWTANEEALVIDGDRTSASAGSTVRLVKLDGEMRAVAQYAYRTEPHGGAIRMPESLAGRERNGVSDLLALPDGTLLVLEREFSGYMNGIAGNRIRIFAVDLRGAPEISASGALSPVPKRLLVDLELGPTNSNFEGMALGPRLANGDRSLLLVADNNGGTAHALYALRISGME